MAGRKTLALTDRQFDMLAMLWEHGPMTVREVLGHLPHGHSLPYTTVLGLLQTMEKAGLITHDAEKLTHRYRPLVSREQATGSLLGDFVRRFFRNSAARLVLSLVDTCDLSPAELREIEAKLAQAQVEGKKPAVPKARRPRRKS